MASKSKRELLKPKENLSRKFLYWALSVLIIKFFIIFTIAAGFIEISGKPFLVDGAWLGADGENYLKGFDGLLTDGVFSTEGILNYWPAGYPLVLLFLSFFGSTWALTTLTIFQSVIFSFATYLFAVELGKTRLKKYSYLVFIMILFNPTLTLSSIAIGYESLTASGFLLTSALVIKDILEKNDKKLNSYLLINSIIFGLMTFMQPRLIVSGILITFTWLLIRKGIKVGTLLSLIAILISLIFPASLIYRNNKAVGLNSISTNLGVTMNIGAGDEATGGYTGEWKGVPCSPIGTQAEKDSQLVKCVIDWYLSNPTKSLKLFYNKSIYFWSPWFGPVKSGTMERNPWLTISPVVKMTSTQEGAEFVYGGVGKIISWLWLLGGLALLFYGYLTLWRQKFLERFIGNFAIIAISTNWLISLISIGDHRFRLPIMGLSLFLQAVGLKTFLRGGKPAMVETPALR
jgi:hypothetical protein